MSLLLGKVEGKFFFVFLNFMKLSFIDISLATDALGAAASALIRILHYNYHSNLPLRISRTGISLWKN